MFVLLLTPLRLITLRLLVLLFDESPVSVGLGDRMLARLGGPARGEERYPKQR